ncbi:MAG: hypothetical protein WBG63_17505 [Phormidesmis sp.]
MLPDVMLPDSERMVFLPQGITGFWFYKDPPPPSTDERDFSAYCHTAARRLRGSVIAKELATEHYPQNFSVITVQLPYETVAILLNAQFPMIAMAQPIFEHEMTLSFIDVPALADEFRKFGCYYIFSASELAQPITDETLSDLSDAEINQIEYWKPSAIGELVFNFWD